MFCFACRFEYAHDIAIDSFMKTYLCKHHRYAIFRSIDQHLDGCLPFLHILLGFWEVSDKIRGVPQCSCRRAFRQGDGLIEWAVPGHDARLRGRSWVKSRSAGLVPSYLLSDFGSPKSRPDIRLMKCSPPQAEQATGSKMSSRTGVLSGSQCCTHLPVIGHLNVGRWVMPRKCLQKSKH